MFVIDISSLKYMNFNQLTFDSCIFSDENKLLKKIFPLFWQNFILFEENKTFFVLVILNLFLIFIIYFRFLLKMIMINSKKFF